MRNLIIEYIETGTSGCCGIDEIHGFVEALIPRSKAPTDEEWLHSLYRVIDNNNSIGPIGPIVLFSGTADQGRYKFSPQGLAKWLVAQGEEVVNTSYVKNNTSGNSIQAFLWVVSSKFTNRLNEYREKQEDNAESRENAD